MACFTTEHVLENTSYRESCRIGDDIWLMDVNQECNFVMGRFHTRTKTFEKIKYIEESSDQFWRDAPNQSGFSLFTSNAKLYMCSGTFENNFRLLEFDTLKLEWKRLVDFGTDYYHSEFIILDRKLHMSPGHHSMQILNLDNFQMRTVELPRSEVNLNQDCYNICELHGVIYLIAIRRPYWRSVYQYDGDKFVDIKKKDSMQWAFEKYDTQLPVMDPYVWSTNNQIYQAFIDHRKIDCRRVNCKYLVIDRFDLVTEQWHTVFQSKYKRNVTNIIGGSDNNAYLISANLVDVVIRDISLKPSLENISLLQLADTRIISYYTENHVSLTNKLPFGLRDRYDNMITWKAQDTPLGQLEYQIRLLEKLEVGKAENLAIRTQLDNVDRTLFSDQQRFEYIVKRRELMKSWIRMDIEQDSEVTIFGELQKEYELVLEQRRNEVIDGREQQQVEKQAGMFDGLSQRYESWVEERVSRKTKDS